MTISVNSARPTALPQPTAQTGPLQSLQQGLKAIGNSIANFFVSFGQTVAAAFNSFAQTISGLKGNTPTEGQHSFEASGHSGTSNMEDLLGGDVPSSEPEKKPAWTAASKPKAWSPEAQLESNLQTASGNGASIQGQGTDASKPVAFSEKQIADMERELTASPFSAQVRSLEMDVSLEQCFNTIIRRPDAVKLMTECKMTVTEAVSITLYTSKAYQPINAEFRSGHPNNAAQAFGQEFKAALDKLPNPGCKTLYRFCNADFPKPIVDLHKSGKIVTYDAVTSTSTGLSEGNKKMFGGAKSDGPAYTFLATPKADTQGKDIKPFSCFPKENEVAFGPGTRFQVTGRRADTAGHLVITMEEV